MENFNHWSSIADALDDALGQVVKKSAFDWLAHAQKQIRANHQIDTGFMINSGYVVVEGASTYAEKLERITTPSTKPTKSGRPRTLGKRGRAIKARMDAQMLPEIAVDTEKGKAAFIAFAAAYAWYQNYGTSHMSARPFLEPSYEIVKPSFDEALRRIDEKLKSIS